MSTLEVDFFRGREQRYRGATTTTWLGVPEKKVDPINSLLHHHFLAVKNLTVQSAGAAAILHSAGSQPAGRALGFTSHHIAYVTYILYILIHTYNV